MKIRRILCIATALCLLAAMAFAEGNNTGYSPVSLTTYASMPVSYNTQDQSELTGEHPVSHMLDGNRNTGYWHVCWSVDSADDIPDITFYFANATVQDIWIRNGWEYGDYYFTYFARVWGIDVTVWCGQTRYDQGRKYLEDSNDPSIANQNWYDGYQRVALNQKYEGVTQIDIHIRQWRQGDEKPHILFITDMMFMPDSLENLYGSGIYNYAYNYGYPTNNNYNYTTPVPAVAEAVNIARSAVTPYNWEVEDRNGQAIGWNIGNLFDGKWSSTMGFVCWSKQATDDIPDISLYFSNATIKDIWLRNGFQADDRLNYARIRQLEVTVWSGDTNYGTQKFKNLVDSIDTAERSATMYDGYQRLSLNRQYQNVTRVDLVIKGWYEGPEGVASRYKMQIADMLFMPDSLENIYGSGIFSYTYNYNTDNSSSANYNNYDYNNRDYDYNNYYNNNYPTPIVTAAPTAAPATPTPRPAVTAAPGQGLQVTTKERLATRSGPGTNYTGTGSYFQAGVTVKALSAAYDKSNGIWWVQVELTYDKELRRVYTGVKRLNMSADQVRIEEGDRGQGKVVRAVYPYYGPGYGYAMYGDKIPAGTTGTILTVESSYVQFEYFDTNNNAKRRVWIPESAIEFDDARG